MDQSGSGVRCAEPSVLGSTTLVRVSRFGRCPRGERIARKGTSCVCERDGSRCERVAHSAASRASGFRAQNRPFKRGGDTYASAGSPRVREKRKFPAGAEAHGCLELHPATVLSPVPVVPGRTRSRRRVGLHCRIMTTSFRLKV